MTLRSAKLPSSTLLTDLPIAFAGIATFYGLLSLARYWAGPVNTQAEIRLSPAALPVYAAYSVGRIAVAYVVSLVVAILYGYAAARNRRAERWMIPLLDTLQSIPVLCFLPGVMVAMVALFPARQLGVEFGSILLLFTGQVWNMAFSFYSSLKSIPREMAEAARIYRMNWWQRFTQLELPFAAIGLVWNSMMSVAGAWFSLMVCEMFVLGTRDFRLPGLGSYLQTASNAGDMHAIAWGLTAMVGVIVLLDQLLWRPVIAWSEKFKFEQVESASSPRSPVLDFLRQSRFLARARRASLLPAREALALRFAHREMASDRVPANPVVMKWIGRTAAVVILGGILFAMVKMTVMLGGISRIELGGILTGAGATFLRVVLTLFLAALWTIPAGVYIGTRPNLSAVAQPLAQIAASVPATALFPIVLMVLIRAGGGLGIASIVLLLLGTQWYILFNVIAGAIAIPSDLKEVCSIFRFGEVERWRKLILPAIFPFLVTGFITASGGAWNASIIAEYFHFQNQTFSTTGLGAVISRATDSGDYPLLLGATLVITIMVVTVNRLVWKRLFALASTKYKLET
jgi:NitT/TauT family transport system permease protein